MDPCKPAVLLVDDDAIVRDVVRQMLERGGYAVVEASSARDALEILRARSNEIALLVSDIQMPGIGGIQLAATVEREYPAVPVLLISACPENHDGELINHPFLAKPFTKAELLNRVQEVLEGGGASPALQTTETRNRINGQ